MDQDLNNKSPDATNSAAAAPASRRPSRRFMMGAALIAVLAIGAVGGATANRLAHRHWPDAVMLLQPAPIAQMKDATSVAVKGQVAELFGNKFVLQDDSGRTLIDTGPRGEASKPPGKGEIVTVQGRFENGFIHAQLMARADGTTEAYGPPHGPRQGPPGMRERGPGPDRGAYADVPPPPPPIR